MFHIFFFQLHLVLLEFFYSLGLHLSKIVTDRIVGRCFYAFSVQHTDLGTLVECIKNFPRKNFNYITCVNRFVDWMTAVRVYRLRALPTGSSKMQTTSV
ncbi:hypothetical protein T07_13835 [Trichinella nelsoni]|uniref:Secreted protein n=1 Tax=Trichinella nelsoni TaxID=6336 RepID=A0A0V0RS06_9BILA|nr:hypothetical protein T07_13835 [Trichinella nelsoni]